MTQERYEAMCTLVNEVQYFDKNIVRNRCIIECIRYAQFHYVASFSRLVLCQSARRIACDLLVSGNVDVMLHTDVRVIEMYSVGSNALVYEENFLHEYVEYICRTIFMGSLLESQ